MSTAKRNRYDIVIIGAGHAGCEAALASARLGMSTALVTFSRDKIAEMSCNPSIGGLAKGHLVREIDALGGEMAKAIDATGIQFRILNRSKGPAVQAPRAQADKAKYRDYFIDTLELQENLTLIYDEAISIETENVKVAGVSLRKNGTLHCRTAVVTTGTFLNGLIHIGLERKHAGRIGDPPSVALSDSLKSLGLQLGRLKTGTPARLLKSSVDFSAAEMQPGDEHPTPFSFQTDRLEVEQVPCWLTHTNKETHDIIRGSLDRSPLYSGVIVGIGPRYCPSIEDKVVKFPDRDRHHVFLEPEGRESELIYPNGISSSLPVNVQERFIRSIPPLRDAEIVLPAYAIEYNFVYPRQLHPTLETKILGGLYLAGQINGTSGYEEAAAQGLMAAVNAVHKIQGKEPIILPRDRAYIGVLIDDLITRDIDEPYRMFTSRAEYRLLLRCDNADRRLMQTGAEIGLLPTGVYNRSQEKYKKVEILKKFLKEHIITENMLSGMEREKFLGKRSTGGVSLEKLVKRPEHNIDSLLERFQPDMLNQYTPSVRQAVETEMKYGGYIDLQQRAAEKAKKLEVKSIPNDFDYSSIPGLSREAEEKLRRFRPATLGQASRISGITPAAVAAVNIAISRAN